MRAMPFHTRRCILAFVSAFPIAGLRAADRGVGSAEGRRLAAARRSGWKARRRAVTPDSRPPHQSLTDGHADQTEDEPDHALH